MPSTLEKIRVLGANSKYDICASTASNRSQTSSKNHKKAGTEKSRAQDGTWFGHSVSCGVCHSYTPDGRCVSLFKVLMTNKCIYDCKYCFTQSLCPSKRMSFTPEEYADTFMKLYSLNVLEGLFLSSGVCKNADETTKKMLKTVRLLRNEHDFRGYIHFKCLPNTSYYLLREAIKYADRISINLEAPTKSYLNEIAGQKSYNSDLLKRQRWLKSLRVKHNIEARKEVKDMCEDNHIPYNRKIYRVLRNERLQNGYQKIRWDGLPILNSGQTTQFVVGAAGETDYDLLKRLDYEYREMDLRRGYFSAFNPIRNTPLEQQEGTPLDREHRLYQADWLLRRYHFHIKELKEILKDDENLPKGDPKIYLAKRFFEDRGPLDPNHASYKELLRVPGIGHTSARRIMNLQRERFHITSRKQLHNIGVVLKRADPFLKINGKTQKTLMNYLGTAA